MTYPQYFKVVDGAGEVAALVCQEADHVTFLTPQGYLETVATIDDVKAKIGGDYEEVGAEFYESTYVTWASKDEDDGNNAIETVTENPTSENPTSENDPGQDSAADAGGDADAADDATGDLEQGAVTGSEEEISDGVKTVDPVPEEMAAKG